jgi:hypothetical protein
MWTLGFEAKPDYVTLREFFERLDWKQVLRFAPRDKIGPILKRGGPEFEALFDCLVLVTFAPQSASHLVQQLQRVEVGDQIHAP